ncbi:hypothetical protein ACO0SA_000366 [Hanseniaspora valbyensis]
MSFLDEWSYPLINDDDDVSLPQEKVLIKINKKTINYIKNISSSLIPGQQTLSMIDEKKHFILEYPSTNSKGNKLIYKKVKPYYKNMRYSNKKCLKNKKNPFEKEKIVFQEKEMNFMKKFTNSNIQNSLVVFNIQSRNNYLRQIYLAYPSLPKSSFAKIKFNNWENLFTNTTFNILEEEIQTTTFYQFESLNSIVLKTIPKLNHYEVLNNQKMCHKKLNNFETKIDFKNWDIEITDNKTFEIQSFEENLNRKLFYLFEQDNNFTKSLKNIDFKVLKKNFREKNMWNMNEQELKRMSWKVFKTLPSKINILKEKICLKNKFANTLELLKVKPSLSYYFINEWKVLTPLKTLNDTGNNNNNNNNNNNLLTISYTDTKQINKQHISDDLNSIISSSEDEKDELDSFIKLKKQKTEQGCELITVNTFGNMECTVNESSFWFSDRIINSNLKYKSTSSKFNSDNNIKKFGIFCNYETISPKILAQLHAILSLNVFEGNLSDFAYLSCEIVLNNKSCVKFINPSTFFQRDNQGVELYYSNDIIKLCENFENLYFLLEDCEINDKSIVLKCKITLLENFHSFANILIFETSNVSEKNLATNIIVPIIEQANLNTNTFHFEELNYDSIEIQILKEYGFDIFSSNIMLNYEKNIWNLVSCNNNSLGTKNISKRVIDKIKRINKTYFY